jgi:hypothetical protein
MKKLILIMMLLFITPFIYSQYESDFTGAEVDAGIVKANKVLLADTVVNLTASMTTGEIQTIINTLPKNLNGKGIVFQFADGTYNLTTSLVFSGYYAGYIWVVGDLSEGSTNYTTQSVIFDGSTIETSPISVRMCWSQVLISNIAVKHKTTSHGILINQVSNVIIRYCYILGVGAKQGGIGNLFFSYCLGISERNSLSNSGNGVYAAGISTVNSINNFSVGTAPNYGLVTVQASTIAKDGTQPTGTLAAESNSAGCVIR